jgi:hypothetical protein
MPRPWFRRHKKERKVNSFDFSFFSFFLMDVMGGKNTINLKELH